jgi:glycosyltransferase involved in cell wall biosynthesis
MTGNKPTISIAMATYNGAKHILRQLDSLAAQTYLPAELVTTDDRSSDDTLAILENFARSSPFPVHIHRNERRLGYRENFMKAASLCSSELIAFCDQDDVWYPHKIETCAALFDLWHVLLVYHDADVVNDSGWWIGSLKKFAAPMQYNPPKSLPPLAYSPGLTQMFRRELLAHNDQWQFTRDHQHVGLPMAHDQFYFSLASNLGTIIYLKEPLVGYVQHGENLFGARLRKKTILKNIALRYLFGIRA